MITYCQTLHKEQLESMAHVLADSLMCGQLQEVVDRLTNRDNYSILEMLIIAIRMTQLMGVDAEKQLVAYLWRSIAESKGW